MRVAALLIFTVLLLAMQAAAQASPLIVELMPASANPAHPRMGDRLMFRSTIRNPGADQAPGVIAWLSLVQVDPGNEKPVDLEDWSAQKALTLPALAPGQTVTTEWPIRLIQAGHYRVAVIATAAGIAEVGAPVASRFAGFAVAAKPVVESGRVLPIAIGVPLLLAAGLLWRVRGGRVR